MKTISFSHLMMLVLLAALSVALTACTTTEDDDQTNIDQPMDNVQQAPPPPEFETIPDYDHQTQAWRPGYWALEGSQFVWVSGKILSKPSLTAVWTAARWAHHTYGWSFEPGHWQ